MRAFEALHPADGLTFDIRSEIPPAAGLGSSAAAIVAGLVAADHMFELDAPLFELARELEGHPDNVAAALLGGFVICAEGEPVRFDPPPGLEGVLARPPGEVPTAEARAAMPAEVPLADAVHNVAHAAMLVLGLARDDLSLVGRGLSDRIHQPRRRALYPRLDGARSSGRRSWARWGPPSRARARRCSSGATGRPPARWWSGSRRGARVGRAPRDLRPGRRGRAGAVSDEIRAAGGVVVRRRRVLLVHRPRYDDWTLPKGKLDPGESWEEAALREVEEEASLRCRLGGSSPPPSTA